ncbi:hypothetical protein EYZ11_007761 [Aspergillus tanneri]|uniref:Peptidase A1 domain-containing protein n=1 Tax=Aspergillus tanneri TaxID=1220188 RepID=A0A4S3JC74_9EURO|nr:uncharacterized protein ATNIH1004_002125 [Aspergillus tanneri]KAA8649454.1 hypothetical protein ATNIH1004_002125 [Aspergillus tanneri]THC92769.1 hypothetical protein EYZ11_007761 [Aspergillus tanneri]
MKLFVVLGLLSSAFAAPAPSGSHGNPAFDMPLTWTPFGFTTDSITVGTPPQRVDSFVDWTWIGQYVFTPRCHGSLSKTSDCLQPSQTLFNQTQSRTYVNQSRLFRDRVWNPNHFFFYDDLSIGFGSDIERVGNHSARITLQMADMHFSLDFAYPFAGVYGLSPVFADKDNASTQSPFYQMWQRGAYRSSIVSFQFCYNSTFGNPTPDRARCHGHDALQTLGGLSPALTKLGTKEASKSILWYDNIDYPIVNDIDFEYDPPIYNYWAARLTKHLIGDEEQALNTTYGGNPGAIFDHASYGHGVPMSGNSYRRLIQLTDGKPLSLDKDDRPNNGNQSFVSVDCDRVSSFPALKYQFEGHDRLWEVIPQNYVERLSLGNATETCVLNVRTLGEGDFVIGNFGDTFAKDKIVLFDFEKMKVGLADMPS